MANKYIVTGTTSSTNGTEGVVLKKDDDGTITKEISATKPANLSNDEVALVRSLGVTVEQISNKDAALLEQQTASISVGADTAGAAPVFDTPTS